MELGRLFHTLVTDMSESMPRTFCCGLFGKDLSGCMQTVGWLWLWVDECRQWAGSWLWVTKQLTQTRWWLLYLIINTVVESLECGRTYFDSVRRWACSMIQWLCKYDYERTALVMFYDSMTCASMISNVSLWLDWFALSRQSSMVTTSLALSQWKHILENMKW